MENQRAGRGWWNGEMEQQTTALLIKLLHYIGKKRKGSDSCKAVPWSSCQRETKEHCEPFASKLNAHFPICVLCVSYLDYFLVIWGNSFATCQWPMIGTVHAWGAEVSSGLSWWFLACCLPIWCNLELRIRVAEASPSQKNILHYSDMGRSFFSTGGVKSWISHLLLLLNT